MVTQNKRWGSYILHEKIGEGGMGVVYRGHRVGAASFSKQVAIKCMHKEYAKDTSLVRMFLDEASTSSKLAHENIVAVEDLGERDGEFYLAMEYVNGATLLALEKKGLARCSAAVGHHVLRSLLAALRYAHNATDPNTGEPLDVVHRDVSPHNILIRRDGVLKLTDFGIAKFRDRTPHTQGMVIRGKPGYMPPEQLTGAAADARADLYAAGATAFQLMTGRLPYASSDPGEIFSRQAEGEISLASLRPDLPFTFVAVVDKLLRLSLAERYQTAASAIADLDEMAMGDAGMRELATFLAMAIPARPTPPADQSLLELIRPVEPAKDAERTGTINDPVRRKWIARVAYVAMFVVLVGVGRALYFWRHPSQQVVVPTPVRPQDSGTPVDASLPPDVAPPRDATPADTSHDAPDVIQLQEPHYGWIHVDAIPWATVSVDGHTIGRTPARFRVVAGTHHVRVSGGVEATRMVQVRANSVLSIRFIPGSRP